MIYIYLFNFLQGSLDINGEIMLGWESCLILCCQIIIVYLVIIILLYRKEKWCQTQRGEGDERPVFVDVFVMLLRQE